MSDQHEPIVVFITAPTKEEARGLADFMVERGLAACVQLLPEIESVYRWQSNLEHQKETLIIVKTTSSQFEELEREVRKMHSYDTPEIVAFPITAGSPAYLQWLGENVTTEKDQA